MARILVAYGRKRSRHKTLFINMRLSTIEADGWRPQPDPNAEPDWDEVRKTTLETKEPEDIG